MEVLGSVAEESNDELVKEFCAKSKDSEKGLFPAYDISQMLFANAYAFPGLTLVADDHPAELMLSMSQRLQEHAEDGHPGR